MSSKSDRSKGAGSGVAMSAGDARQVLQPVRFGSSESEAQVRSLLSKADTMRVRVRLADEQDVEGHLFGGGDSSLVLALQLSGDDDVEGHAISIHFPDAEQARRFRNELLAAGVLTATLAMGVGTGIALAPHQTGTAAAPASQATVFMDTSAQAREGGAITQSSTLAIPVGSASDIAQKAQAAESGVTGPALKSQVGSQSKAGAAVNPAAAADAARTEAGISGSLAGTTMGTAGNPAAAADAARTQAGITGSLAGSTTGNDVSTRAREGGATSSVNQVAAGDAARTEAGITGSLAGSSTGDVSTQAREGGALSETAVNPAAAADAARTAAGISGSLAGSTARETSAAQQISDEIAAARTAAAQTAASAEASIPQGASALSAADQINAEIAAARAAATPAADAQTQAREGGALSQATTNPTPKVDYSGKPLPPEPTSASDTSQSSPNVDYSGKPLPTE